MEDPGSNGDPRVHRPTTLSLRGATIHEFHINRRPYEITSADRGQDAFPRRRRQYPDQANRSGSPWYGGEEATSAGGGCPAPAVSWDAAILQQSQPNVCSSTDSLDYPGGAVGAYDQRARSLVRTAGSRMSAAAGRRSRSEGPSMGRGKGIYNLSYLSRPPPFGCDVDVKLANQSHPPPAPSAYVPKDIDSEYRLQYAWPTRSVESTPRRHARGVAYAAQTMQPALAMQSRQSQSLGLLQQQEAGGWSRSDRQDAIDGADEGASGGRDSADIVDGDPTRRKKYKTEYKKNFRPFSAYQYIEGQWRKVKHAETPGTEHAFSVTNTPMDGGATAAAAAGSASAATSATDPHAKPWYAEVTELRKQASEYKCRGWGTGLTPEHLADVYSKQAQFLEQSGGRSHAMSLGALVSPASLRPDRDSREPSAGKEKEKPKPAASEAKKPTKPTKTPAVAAAAAARAQSARAKTVPETAASAARARPKTAPKPSTTTARAPVEVKPKVAEKPTTAKLQQASRVKREVEKKPAASKDAPDGKGKAAEEKETKKVGRPATGGWTAHLPASQAGPQAKQPAKKPASAAAPAAPAAAAKRPASASTASSAPARKPAPAAARPKPAPAASKPKEAPKSKEPEPEQKPKPIKPRKATQPAAAPAKKEAVEQPIEKKEKVEEAAAEAPAPHAPVEVAAAEPVLAVEPVVEPEAAPAPPAEAPEEPAPAHEPEIPTDVPEIAVVEETKETEEPATEPPIEEPVIEEAAKETAAAADEVAREIEELIEKTDVAPEPELAPAVEVPEPPKETEYEVPAFSLDSQFTSFGVTDFPLFNQTRYDPGRAARFGGGTRDTTPP